MVRCSKHVKRYCAAHNELFHKPPQCCPNSEFHCPLWLGCALPPGNSAAIVYGVKAGAAGVWGPTTPQRGGLWTSARDHVMRCSWIVWRLADIVPADQ